MTLAAWLLFCATETALCVTPGPAVLLVVSLALTRGAAAGLRGSAGILASNTLYFVLSGTGIGAVLLTSWQLFLAVKWIGAGYLVWLGTRMLLAHGGAPDLPAAGPSSLAPFLQGVVTQGANPKALLFFTALLPQFIHPEAGVAVQLAILGVSSIVIELLVLTGYVTIAARARRMMRRPALARSLQRAGGALLIGAGARLAAIGRP